MNISLDIDVLVQNGELILTNRQGQSLTYSREQAVQKKVSMITFGELCPFPKIQVAKAFGFSTRKSYYDIRHHVLHGVPADLLPKRTGPAQPTKRTKELEILVIRLRLETGSNMYQITDQLNRMGFDIRSRLTAQILADYGLTKKKR